MGKQTDKSKAGGVVVSAEAPKAKEVFVAGTFNNWDPRSHPLTRTGDGNWVRTLDLPAGRYEYKFVIDGEWCCEPGCEHEYRGCPKCCANDFGTMNRVLVVEDTVEQLSRQRQLAEGGTIDPKKAAPDPVTVC